MNTLHSTRAVRKAPGEAALTLLRVGTGFVLASHGWAKLMDVPAWQAQVESLGMPAPAQLAWLAIAGELLGGLGLAVGLFTGLAALGVAFTMATAIVQVHWGNGLFASEGGMELPLLNLLVAMTFMLRGGGPLSADALIRYARRGKLREPADQPASTVPRHPTPHFSDR